MYKNYTRGNGIANHYIIKILLIMRLTAIIIFFAILQTNASSYAQKIAYARKNVRLLEVFKAIKKQTGFNVIYSDRQIDVNSRIDANFPNVEMEDVMGQLLKNYALTYTINKKNVIIKPKSPTFLEEIKEAFLSIDVHGKIVDSLGIPLQGATIKIKNKKTQVITNQNGDFYITDVDENDIIIISYLGYQIREVKAKKELGEIKLEVLSDDLSEVAIVSTGYQELPKERATGSFTTINEKTLNRNVGINILDRLEGVASGVLLNKTKVTTNDPKLAIHGRSTLFANPEPLIVLDGFPYEGTIDQINPADISSINLLKDAAASSIWGVRSSNGVLVITTKKGSKGQNLTIGATSVYTISDKPNPYYREQMSSADFIDLEQFLFSKGYYNSRLNQIYNYVSPAVEIFNLRRADKISSSDSMQLIQELKSFDIRKDYEKYIYRKKLYQQHQINFSGGTKNQQYYISAGYDRNIESKRPENYDRVTLNSNNIFNLFNDKVEIQTGVNFASSNTKSSSSSYDPYTPYDRLTDQFGNHMAVVTTNTLRKGYTDTVGRGKLLDWSFKPLDELYANRNVNLNQYRIKAGILYRIIEGLQFSANYQYLNENGNSRSENDMNRFYTRNLINRYSSLSDGNTVNRVIPLGSILNQSNSKFSSKVVRIQGNYTKLLNRDHEINVIVGYEGGDNRGESDNQTLYGYDPDTRINSNGSINPLARYKYFYNTTTATIPTNLSVFGSIDINQSYFSNASYVFKNRYIFSASGRRDESNLFGVKTNQKGVPLWSTGLAWIVTKEKFYNLNWLPLLKLRATYGYNGNIDKSTSAYLATRKISSLNDWGDAYSIITNPNNPDLRWEKTKTMNLGLDFNLKNNRISGSIDFYYKHAVDIIGNSPISFITGVEEYRGNNANMQTRGFDIVIDSKNLIQRFKWTTSFLLSYNKEKVTKYKLKQISNLAIVNSNYSNPLEGYPYYSIFSFPSAGLDANGKVRGYLNGEISQDLATILYSLDPLQLKFHGSASPQYFGSIINTFEFKRLELSFNITYKFDYYFRKSNVFAGNPFLLTSTSGHILADYEKRWKIPGDELITQIPALTYPADLTQSSFFENSDVLVEKGDHIRLQDIRLSYNIPGRILPSLPFNKINLFIYAKNLGILWRANKSDIDPDYGTTIIPQPLSCSFGLNFSL